MGDMPVKWVAACGVCGLELCAARFDELCLGGPSLHDWGLVAKEVTVSATDTKTDMKDTNPKAAFGDAKIPMYLWPETASALGSLGLLDGACKYGRSNWRASGVRASTYVAAIRRHTLLWNAGEDIDPDSGLSHLAHILACTAILVDALAYEVLVDDREFGDPAKMRKWMDGLTPHVTRVKQKYADRHPKPVHYDRSTSVAPTQRSSHDDR